MAVTSDTDASATRPLPRYSHDYASPDSDPVCCIRSRALPTSSRLSRNTPSSRSSISSSSNSSSPRSFIASSVSSLSSQSTKESLSSLSSGTWENEDDHETSYLPVHHFKAGNIKSFEQRQTKSDSVASVPTHQVRLETLSQQAVPLEQRKHPRRTQRLINGYGDNGDLSAPVPCSRPPPTLVRQSERKDAFVESLVDTTTQMIETIWPLSALSCTRDSPLHRTDQDLIELKTFVQEVLKRSKTSYSTLQVALYYLVLIQPCIPKQDFTMEQVTDSQACRAMQCGRRMFLTALIVASKYLQDRTFSARAWSKISGLKTTEINANERAFLAAIKWKLHVPEPLFNRWTDLVLKFSPSSLNPPTSPSGSTISWKSIIPHITPDLDDVVLGSMVISTDSRNHFFPDEDIGPSALPTPPPETNSPTMSESNEPTPTNPYSAPKVLEPIPCGSSSSRPILPPIQCPGLLPTPTMTPQTGIFCTPAASAYGLCGLKSSMRAAMSQVQNNILSRSTLDNPNYWKSSSHASVPASSRRPSLAPSSSTLSSPESMVSDVSSRRSRSSSISSVASSACALPRPRLAVQATRRCATMKMASLKEGEETVLLSSPHEDYGWDGIHTSPDEISTPESDYFSKIHHSQPRPQFHGLTQTTKSYSHSTHEAATALHGLALKCRQANAGPINSRKRDNTSSDVSVTTFPPGSGQSLHQMMPCPSTKSRKRERTSSTDLSVQSRVRDLIAPRCLGDITNGTRSAGDNDAVLPDDRVAQSVAVLNKYSTFESNVQWNSKDVTPRKRTCGIGGTKENCHPNQHPVKERFAMPAPGMWEGII